MYKKMAFTNIDKNLVREMTPSNLTIPPNVITSLTKQEFFDELKNNQSVFIIKFGAEWCGPCKKIDPCVYQWMGQMPPTIKCVILDIDDNFEVYAFLKSKKMVNGIPAILGYFSGNDGWVPDEFVVGANETEVKIFFEKCLKNAA
jgi:thioredoxin 1